MTNINKNGSGETALNGDANHFDLSSGRLICPLPDLRLPLMRYYYGVSQDAGPDTQVFIDWMFAQISRDTIQGADGYRAL